MNRADDGDTSEIRSADQESESLLLHDVKARPEGCSGKQPILHTRIVLQPQPPFHRIELQREITP